MFDFTILVISQNCEHKKKGLKGVKKIDPVKDLF